jgi:hypothetical protein
MMYLWCHAHAIDWQEKEWCGKRIICCHTSFIVVREVLQQLSETVALEMSERGLALGLGAWLRVDFSLTVPEKHHALIWIWSNDERAKLNLVWRGLDEHNLCKEVHNG